MGSIWSLLALFSSRVNQSKKSNGTEQNAHHSLMLSRYFKNKEKWSRTRRVSLTHDTKIFKEQGEMEENEKHITIRLSDDIKIFKGQGEIGQNETRITHS